MDLFILTLKNVVREIVEGVDGRNEWEQIYESQKCNWDCGIACCIMVLRWTKCGDTSTIDTLRMDRNGPLWTIELFVLLRKLSVNALMYTKYKGVNPDLST